MLPLRRLRLLTMSISSGHVNNLAAVLLLLPRLAQVREGRPLTEVIAAANAELSSRYERHAQAGLREICVRLREAASAALAGSDGGASDAQQQQQRSACVPPGPPASGGDGSGTSGSAGAGGAVDGSGAAGGDAGGEVREQRDDLYLLVSLLRRLLLWPVTGELLQATQAGRVVGQLRKHPNEQVRAPSCPPGGICTTHLQVAWLWLAAMQHAAERGAVIQLQPVQLLRWPWPRMWWRFEQCPRCHAPDA